MSENITIQSGYTHCACRDCMDTTVSSDMSKPELCDACRNASCPSLPERATYPESRYWECQRDDAYGDGDEGCEGHYDSDEALTSGVGIGEPIFCDGSCVTN